MVTQEQTERRTPTRRLLEELIAERGLQADQYALFFVTGEGSYLPTGAPDSIEESSGYVLDRRGRVHSFWLAWDAVQRRPALTAWEEVEPEASWETVREYRDARRRLGLPQ
jgi:hypothetical protein